MMFSKKRRHALTKFIHALAFVLAGIADAFANVTVTPASGGASISADTAANATSPSWTTLGAITIAEGANGDFATGNGVTLVLKAPGGFEFNTSVTPDVTFTPGRNISSASVAVNDSTTITVTLDVSNLIPLPAADTLTIGSTTGVEVRPTAGAPLANGARRIYRPTSGGGTAAIAGITTSANGLSGTSFGDLNEVAGAPSAVHVETLANGNGAIVPAQNITAGSSLMVFAIMRDAFGNFVTNGTPDSWSLPIKTGGVVDGDSVPSANLKSNVFTGHLTGTATIRAISGALASTDSGLLTVVPGAATKLAISTQPSATATAGTNFDQQPGILIQDAFNNTRSSDTTVVTATRNGGAGILLGTTNRAAVGGVATYTNLAHPFATNITLRFTASGLTAVTSTVVSVTSGPFSRLLALLPGETNAPATATGRTGTPSAIAGANTPVRVNATDVYFNLVDTVTDIVGITVTDPNATLPVDSALVDGTNTFGLIFKTAGSQTVTASDVSDGTKTANNDTVTVGPGTFVKLQLLVPGETNAAGTVSGKIGTPTAQTAGTPFNVSVRGVDANWNQTNVSGSAFTIHITSTDANATLPADANLSSGIQTFSVTLKTAGSATMTASDVDDGTKTPSTSPAITVNTGTLSKLQLLVPGETAAPGSATGKTGTPAAHAAGELFNVTVNSVDANWNLVSTNDTVRLTSSDAGAVLGPDAALVNGTQTFSVTLNTIGSRTVTASDLTHAGVTSNTSPSISVIATNYVKLQLLMPGETAAPGTPTGKTGTPTAQTAGNPFNVIVKAVDPNWNQINTVTNTVAITSSDTNATLPANLALIGGSNTFSVTLKTSGSQTVTATDVNNGGITPGTGGATTVNPGVATKLAIGSQPSATAIAGTNFDQQPVILIQDAFNNVRSNDTLTVTASRNTGAGLLLGTTNRAAVGGVVTYTNLAHPYATNITLRFTSGGLTAVTSSVVTVNSGPFSRLLVLLPGETNAPVTATGRAGTPAASAGTNTTVRVNATDAYFNLVDTGADVVGITVTDTNATLPANAALVNGTNSFNLIFKTAGSQTVTATDVSDGTKTANNDTVTVGAGALVKLQLLAPGETNAPGTASGKTGTPTAQTAGTAFTVTVRGVDANWNQVSAASGGSHTIHVTSSDTNATLPSDASLSSGAQTFSVTMKTAGSATVTASHVDDPTKTSSTSPEITLNPGAFVKLQLLVPDEAAVPGTATGKTYVPLAQRVGDPFNVIVNAVDANWNLVNTNDTIHLTSSDPGAVLGADAALVNGTQTFSVTLNTVGSRTVTASDLTHAGITSNTSPAITVSTNVNLFVKLQVLMPGETNAPGTPSGKIGSPTARTAGTAFNVTVNAVDTNWNVINTVTDTVRITSSDTNAILPGNAALVSGTRAFSVTLRTSGSQTVTASDMTHGSIIPDTGTSTAVNPAVASKLAIATQPSSTAYIAAPFAQQPVVTIRDAFDNVRSNDTLVVSAHRSAGAGTLLGTTNLAAVNGVVTYTNLAHPVATNITIQFTSGSLTSVTSSNISVLPNSPPTIAGITPITSSTVYVDHPALFRFNVSDIETPESALQLSMVSSDPVLFPPGSVVFHFFLFDSGPDQQNWYATITPAFGLTGTATNTLIVSDGTNSSTADFVVTVTPPPPGSQRFANTNAITVPIVGTATPYPSTINVSDMSGTITNVTLTLSGIYHQFVKDMHMLLVGPTGQGMVVFSRVSDGPVTNVTATMTDVSPFTLPESFDLWSEQFRPSDFATTNGTFSDNNFPSPAPPGPYGPVSFSNSFGGLPANGTWSLYVYDDHGPDSGGIARGWSLMVGTTGGGSVTTISDIPHQSTTVGTPTAAIPFSLSDPGTPVGTLTLSGDSSNLTLVPTNNIVFGGSGSNRTVTVTPAPSQTGTATITVAVHGGSSSASDTFVLTVSTVNTPPTISGIADQAIDEDTNTGAIAFTIGDAEAGSTNVNLSKGTSNPTLVPTNNIVFGGSGANRTVTVTPVASQSGTATITVAVSDGQLSTNTSFVVTVNAVNDPPTISNIPNQSTPQSTATAAIPFAVGDSETPAASLTLSQDSSNPTLVPTNNIVFGGSGVNRTVTITPVTGLEGNTTITVTVSDGTNSASDTFLLTVGPANTPPTISPIADRTTLMERAVGPFNITIGDAETNAGSLTLSGTSSNTNLVPNANIVTFNGFGIQTLAVAPAAGQMGTATITVSVSDGTSSTSTSFLLTVGPPDSATGIFDNANPLIVSNRAAATMYPSTNQVSGMLGVATKVTLTLKDINHSVPSDLQMLLVGPAGQKAVILSQVGSTASNVTITLDDSATYGLPSSSFALLPGTYKPTDFGHFPFTNAPGEPYATTMSAFNGASPNGDWLLYVLNSPSGSGSGTINRGWSLAITTDTPNSPPTISTISNQTTGVSTATAAIPFTISDADTAPGSLFLSAVSSNPALVTTNDIVFGGSGSNRTVTLTPVTNQIGTATITLIVSDGHLSASNSFVLTVAELDASVTLVGLSQTYDGTARVVTATTVPTGLTVDITYDGSPNAPTNAGNYQVIGTINDASYTGSSTNQLTVTPKLLTVSGVTANNKVYDGNTNATLNLESATLVGVVGADDVTLKTLVYDNSVNNLSALFDPGAIEVGDEIILGGPAQRVSRFSYEIWGAGGDSAGLPQNDITVTLRFYANDGAPVSGYPSPGSVLYQSDPFTIEPWMWNLYGGSGGHAIALVYDPSDFTDKAVVPLTASLPASFTWTVQFSAAAGADKFSLALYHPPVIGQSYPDYWELNGSWQLKTNATAPINFAARLEAVSAFFADKNVGTNKPVTVSGLALGGTGTGNYTLTQPAPTANITARPLSVVGHNATRVFGENNPVFTGTITGVVDGENITASYSSAATTASLPGTYDIVPTLNDPGSNLGNYALTVNNGILTIVDVPRLLSVAESPEGTFNLIWQVYAGRSYRFQYKNHLLESNWTDFGPTNTAASSSLTNVDNAGVNIQRFYRALDTPAP